MGNQNSSEQQPRRTRDEHEYPGPQSSHSKSKSFPGSALLDGTAMMCGIDTTENSVMHQADQMCTSTPTEDEDDNDNDLLDHTGRSNPTSALFARALVSEVTDNPNTMTPAKMTEREKKLLKAQDAARKVGAKAVGAPGGVGQPSLFGSIAHALAGSTAPDDVVMTHRNKKTVEPPSSLQENRAQAVGHNAVESNVSKHRITVGLSLSRRHSTVGHPDTVTRQTAFDFNELQDREYKYVSSTDATGWRAGGGERGGRAVVQPISSPVGFDGESDYYQQKTTTPSSSSQTHKVAAPDTVHIPIIHIDAESPEAVDLIIAALARGEVFIPHMGILPEALSVNGISPPDLVVRFGCERNDDAPPDEWPNWCLEFMHNQLYEYFHNMGARWMKRPFQITLAKKVRWKTVKHMNRYFAHAERVLDAWREKGPQNLDPQLSYIEGGATPEEVARPHGIYLLRNGVPTNYFSPNFDPPYTTKMTRSLLTNVLDKSWDKKRREWTSEPVPRLVTPASLIGNLCGCTDASQGGFMANQVTSAGALQNTVVDTAALTLDDDSRLEDEPSVITSFGNRSPARASEKQKPEPFKLHPIDTARSPASGYMSFASSEGVTAERSFRHSPTDNRSPTELDYISPAASLSDEEESPPLDRPRKRAPTPEQKRAPTPENKGRTPSPEQQAVSEVAPSAVTVQHINTSHLMRSNNAKTTNTTQKKKHMSKEDRDAGMTLEIAKVALLQEIESTISPRPSIVDQASRDPKKMELAQAVAHYEEKKSDASASLLSASRYVLPSHLQTVSSDSLAMERTDSRDSNVSLEYSIESSMLGGGDSSMTGHYFNNNDGTSVYSGGSKRRSGKKATKSTPMPKTVEDELSVSVAPSFTDNMSMNSGGTSITDAPAPSDQDLFTMGWAKALDPKTGSYYYFTLDRSKIVWDNPLIEKSVFSGSTASSQR